MVIYSLLIISRNGGLIYYYDHKNVDCEVEKTFSYPLDLKLNYNNQRITVTFGQRDGIKVGYALLSINGEDVSGRKLGERDILNEILANAENFPINIKFGIPKLTTNEKIIMASTFHSMYAIAAVQLHPDKDSRRNLVPTGIEELETENFILNCFQSLTGLKIITISDLTNYGATKEVLLRKIYDIYSDYAVKNPFYSLDMPIRCELFESKLKQLLEQMGNY